MLHSFPAPDGERPLARNLSDQHSVDVLLRVYAKCIDGGEEIGNEWIDEALVG